MNAEVLSERAKGIAMLVSHVQPLAQKAAAALSAEGRRFLRFLAPEAEAGEVRL